MLADLLTDSSAPERMRIAALEALLLIDDPRLNAALSSAVNDAGLEGTYLLERIEELLRERKVRLAERLGGNRGLQTLDSSRSAKRPRSAMNLRLPAAALLATLALGLVSACSDKTPDAGSAEPAGAPAPGDASVDAASVRSDVRNPCDLLTDAELSALVGGAVSRIREVEENRGKTCEWEFPNTGPPGSGTATVAAWHGREFYTPDAVHEGFTAVPGIGDVAHRDQAMLIFRKGGDVVGVHVTGQFSGDMDVEVAKLVASKL
jgi:Protein of unknown function (DUF3558)